MLKRRLSLEQTWQKCLKSWKEMIEKHWKPGMSGETLKYIYFRKHPKMAKPFDTCYLCDYAERKDGCFKSCPGLLVDKNFTCTKDSYHYHHKPKAFYRKFVALDKKRKAV